MASIKNRFCTSDAGRYVALAAGGGYGIVGAIYCFDANGNIVWTKSIAGTDWVGMSGMKLLSDGGFLILGQSSASLSEQNTEPGKT